MGRVYLCRHHESGEKVAIKVTSPGAPEQVAERTLREGKVLASLQHPGLPRLLDHGPLPDGTAFLVLEYLEGRSLDHPPPPEDPPATMLEVARALASVHRAGILHRDLKPANIVLTADGRAVLVDFGLAHDPDHTRMTATGRLVGTPAYLAPELLTGNPQSPVTDWYAWAASLYVLIEGGYPYPWEDLMAHATEGRSLPPPAFEKLLEGTPCRVLLEGMLRPDPGTRLADLGTIEAALGPRGEVPRLPPLPSPRTVAEPRLEPPPEPDPGPPPGGDERFSPSLLLPLVALVLAMLWPTSPPTPPEAGPVPSPPPASPESPRENSLDAAHATRVRLGRLLERARAFSREHRETARLLVVSWNPSEIPPGLREHATDSLTGPPELLARPFEALVEAFLSWKTQLADWGRDHPGNEDPFSRDEIRPTLQGEILPALIHALDDLHLDQALRSSLQPDRLLEELASEREANLVRLQSAAASLRLSLEEGELPRGLFPLRLVLPERKGAPGLPASLLPRLRRSLEEPRDRQELWLLARGTLHALTHAPRSGHLPWETRLELLDHLESTLFREDSPLPPFDRKLLKGRLLLEYLRLARVSDAPRDLGLLPERILQSSRRFRRSTRRNPRLRYTALWCCTRLEDVGKRSGYLEARLSQLLPGTYDRAVLVPFLETRGALPLHLGRQLHDHEGAPPFLFPRPEDPPVDSPPVAPRG